MNIVDLWNIVLPPNSLQDVGRDFFAGMGVSQSAGKQSRSPADHFGCLAYAFMVGTTTKSGMVPVVLLLLLLLLGQHGLHNANATDTLIAGQGTDTHPLQSNSRRVMIDNLIQVLHVRLGERKSMGFTGHHAARLVHLCQRTRVRQLFRS